MLPAFLLPHNYADAAKAKWAAVAEESDKGAAILAKHAEKVAAADAADPKRKEKAAKTVCDLFPDHESLKDLKVTRTNVSEDGVAALQKKLPGAKIQLKYIAGDGN